MQGELCTRSSCTRVAFYIDDASRCVVPEGACLEHVLALLETGEDRPSTVPHRAHLAIHDPCVPKPDRRGLIMIVSRGFSGFDLVEDTS